MFSFSEVCPKAAARGVRPSRGARKLAAARHFLGRA
jgi:hypothetical protein